VKCGTISILETILQSPITKLCGTETRMDNIGINKTAIKETEKQTDIKVIERTEIIKKTATIKRTP
jgi:formylmethanofuran dehydrogenase subunit B